MRSWPHAPSKIVTAPGRYLITAATYQKQNLFADEERLELLHDILLEIAELDGWKLDAWAVFANHYHLLGESPNIANPAAKLTKRVHGKSATLLNRLDSQPGRRVWFRSWDTRITHHSSYLARLAYVHHNAVHHRVAKVAEHYPWCSAKWFVLNAEKPLYDSVVSLNPTRLAIRDDF